MLNCCTVQCDRKYSTVHMYIDKARLQIQRPRSYKFQDYLARKCFVHLFTIVHLVLCIFSPYSALGFVHLFTIVICARKVDWWINAFLWHGIHANCTHANALMHHTAFMIYALMLSWCCNYTLKETVSRDFYPPNVSC